MHYLIVTEIISYVIYVVVSFSIFLFLPTAKFEFGSLQLHFIFVFLLLHSPIESKKHNNFKIKKKAKYIYQQK